MNDKGNYIESFVQNYLVPKIGIKPLLNLKDIRNRRKVANAVEEILLSDLKIQLTEQEVNDIKNKLENVNLKKERTENG